MGEVMFVIKSLIVTVVLIVCLQIRVGQRTVEGHAMSWIHHSSISQHLQDVAEGAVKVANKGKSVITGLIGSSEPAEQKATEASTGGWFKIKRSAAYGRQKERERANRERSTKATRAESSDNADVDHHADVDSEEGQD